MRMSTLSDVDEGPRPQTYSLQLPRKAPDSSAVSRGEGPLPSAFQFPLLQSQGALGKIFARCLTFYTPRACLGAQAPLRTTAAAGRSLLWGGGMTSGLTESLLWSTLQPYSLAWPVPTWSLEPQALRSKLRPQNHLYFCAHMYGLEGHRMVSWP